jgi:transcriptional regulator with XRE-family HTH domain
MKQHDTAHRLVRDLNKQLAEDPAAHAEFLKLNVVEQLLERADALGMSRADIAREYGCSPQYLTKLLAGMQNLTIDTIARLAHVVGATVEVVFVTPNQQRGTSAQSMPPGTSRTELTPSRRTLRRPVAKS